MLGMRPSHEEVQTLAAPLRQPILQFGLTPAGSVFELCDLFVRFRSWVWTGETKRWKVAGEKLCELLALREQGDPTALRKRAQAARYKLMNLLYYLQANLRSLIDYRSWQRAERRISAGGSPHVQGTSRCAGAD
jgi:hypothetical protein